MGITNIVSILGGLALFLYGVTLMGDGLNKVAGNKLQVVLYRMTSNPLKGILLGAGVTALVQSSTAVSVMAIGFVNSGLMEFAQAVSIILGAIVGTSVTGWIVSLSSLGAGGGWTQLLSAAFITGVIATIGIILVKFSKKQSHNQVGAILLGFAILMFGMTAMSNAVIPLKEDPAFINLLTKFSNPVLGILVGIVFTAIIQSSAAAVGILQALSMTGTLSFSETFPIILGIAVGGALPVLISALGASLNAKRTALVHLIIDIVGAVFCGVVFYVANAVHPFAFMEHIMSPVSVAALNTIFRIVVVIALAPAIKLLERVVKAIMKDEPEDGEGADWVLLEDRFIQHPTLAIEQCRIVLNSMAEHAQHNLSDALFLLWHYSESGFKRVVEEEDLVDHYEDRLGSYLIKVTSSELTQKQNEDIYQFLHAITDLERISDHALNIAESAQEIHEKGIVMEEEVRNELKVLEAALTEVVRLAVRALRENDHEAAHRVEPLEELIDTLTADMKHRQVDRLQRGVYSRQNSFVFNDLIGDIERVSDHCSNVAVAMIELEHESFDTHQYIESLMSQKDEEFERYFEEYKERFHFEEASI
ncbi:MAG: Na/Pi cotransporter family protein [Firmicutes bacterium]|nr:Na/Pi cotransporter family protein [Bacillota bacterium]